MIAVQSTWFYQNIHDFNGERMSIYSVTCPAAAEVLLRGLIVFLQCSVSTDHSQKRASERAERSFPEVEVKAGVSTGGLIDAFDQLVDSYFECMSTSPINT